MMFRFPSEFFVAGTDTGVGKTVVAAILTAGLGGIYWKPVQSGLDGVADTERVRRLTGLGETPFCPGDLSLAPPALAPRSGRT